MEPRLNGPIGKKRTSTLAACALLALAVLAVYAPVYRHDFINYDDLEYVADNAHVQAGLTWEGIGWAFSNLHGEHTYWHPLTWLAHMLNCQLFGVNAGAHHLVNVLVHCANTLLVFLLLKRMTGSHWRSLLVAALFGLHPLQVDTVAWVSELKNLLSTFFGLGAIMAYVRYAKGKSSASLTLDSPPPAFDARHSALDYSLVLLFFALSLMCKPALVTLPCALLLLDFWPLHRLDLRQPFAKPVLLLEKLAFLALAVAASLTTIAAHHELHAYNNPGVSFGWRVANALVSYARYLGKTFWPENLVIFYPHPGTWPLLSVAGSAVVLLTVSLVAFWRKDKSPYLLTGWFWFLGVLVPMIGLVQAGLQAMAERFAYVPLVGLFVMLAWGVAELSTRWRWPNSVPAALGVLAISACALASIHQLGYWQNTKTLFEHELAVAPPNCISHLVLGTSLEAEGQLDAALAHYRAGAALDPSVTLAKYNIASVLQKRKQWRESAEQYEIVLRDSPDYFPARVGLAAVLDQLGQAREAQHQLEEALRIQPDSAEALNNLAWRLATGSNAALRNGARAVELASRACQLTRNERAVFVGTLAAAYAEAGRFAEAIATAEKAAELASKAGDDALLQRNRELLEFYRAQKPYHEPAREPVSEQSPKVN